RLADVVRDQPDAEGPDDPARGVPGEEPPPRHAREARHPRSGDAHAAEERRQEDRLAAVPIEEALGRGQDPVAEALEQRKTIDQAATAFAPDPLADVVADDRGDRSDGDHA